MLVLSIGCEARYGATGRITDDLIAGVIVSVIGGLMFVPAFRVLLGLPPKLTAGPGPAVPGRRPMAIRSAAAAAIRPAGPATSAATVVSGCGRPARHAPPYTRHAQPITSTGPGKLRRWRRSATQA